MKMSLMDFHQVAIQRRLFKAEPMEHVPMIILALAVLVLIWKD